MTTVFLPIIDKEFKSMTKIAMIGADSTVFVKNILGDLFLSEG